VLALYSAPSWDANRFIGGIPAAYWDSLNTDPRNPLYNKVLQGEYPPGSTFKLATAVTALENHMVTMNDHMPIACSGGLQYGSRYFHCDAVHGSLSLAGAIAKSCNVYFYQLGIKLGLTRLLAGGVDLGFRERSGIDLPEERRPLWPETTEYFNRRYGKGGWTSSVVLNLAIGQGENAQTVINMAKFYTALATDGSAAKPEVAKLTPARERLFSLDSVQFSQLRAALANVVESGTAVRSKIQGVVLAGKTGTAQSRKYDKNGKELNFSWFVGFAPADDPKIVVAMMLEYVPFQGATTATLVSKIIGSYLHATPVVDIVPYRAGCDAAQRAAATDDNFVPCSSSLTIPRRHDSTRSCAGARQRCSAHSPCCSSSVRRWRTFVRTLRHSGCASFAPLPKRQWLAGSLTGSPSPRSSAIHSASRFRTPPSWRGGRTVSVAAWATSSATISCRAR
jgi:penicillin-binding protein 2